MSQPTLEPFMPIRLIVRFQWYMCARAGCSASLQNTRRMAMGAYCVLYAASVCKNATHSRHTRSMA
eukprot:3622813-Pleurochrysis_carterae.AAC.1